MFVATGIGPALKYLKDHQSRNFCTLSSGTAALRVGAFVFNIDDASNLNQRLLGVKL
jgi:hypothetical protein